MEWEQDVHMGSGEFADLVWGRKGMDRSCYKGLFEAVLEGVFNQKQHI